MFPDISKINDLIGRVPALERMLENSVGWMKCLFQEQEKTNRMLERAHGSIDGLNLEKYPPRGLAALPEIFEGDTDGRLQIPFVEGGYTPSDGFYANLGDKPMRVTLIGVNGQGTPHIVPPGASIAVRSLLKGALVEPVTAGDTVTFQFYLL